ncbi:FecR domain-containing protein [Methylophaga sp.]|uniref:FecR domain-containing protein n=1 Tax=Methylophaga sp. TaxID=2024840 RepID=UPI002717885E|nr:FecR domain-containing protein [Methylophaga sp.]MDO8825790.1 FecR domain-containing protein [Methylophaga sp.]
MNDLSDSVDGEPLPDAIVDAAILWAVKLNYNQASEHNQQSFEAWLSTDPLHAKAWQRIGLMQAEFSSLPEKLALQTLKKVDAKRQSTSLDRRQALKLLSVSGVFAMSGWLAHQHTPWQRLMADASTAIGEQRTLTLADGSVIQLNTDTAISTLLDATQRNIILHRGEILITTGSDDVSANKRPFWVQTPVGKLQALGTRFVVRLEQERALISVQQGAVELYPVNSNDSVVVAAGERRWLTINTAQDAANPGFEDDAWADGVIAGQNIRLADLLAELARYRHGVVQCDPRINDLRVSGTFHLKNTDQALQFLVQTQPIKISYRTRFWVSVSPS